ncbi:hypothetical protein M153_1600007472 [Pseudoloma neurophilia]|uniref:Uncharacterized protein n=1 Tax=Pseudoloma neurophilia TaxID=146866 RepID=A0A0R0LZW4_9MICR|nr:hypothetical protein M153_1600007472 [Pseudoloma neurophilia]
MDETLTNLEGLKVFSTIYFNKGFNKIEVDKKMLKKSIHFS